MSAPHLLSLADLHAVAPGVLDVIFGADGDFEGAPVWGCSLWCWRPEHDSAPCWVDWSTYGTVGVYEGEVCLHWIDYTIRPLPVGWFYLDLRIPSIAARLAGLCCRAANPSRMLDSWQRAADLASRASRGEWDPEYAPALAALTLTLSPRIAALGDARV